VTPTELIFTDLEFLGIASAAAAAMLYVLRFCSFKVRLRWNHLWRYVRWAFQTVILRKHIARQRYHIAPLENADLEEAVFQELVVLGYQPNYFAYCDHGERYNLRRLRFSNGKLWQDHVRVFPDEVRGHSEISYEEDAALHARATTVEALPVETQQALQWAVQNVRRNAAKGS